MDFEFVKIKIGSFTSVNKDGLSFTGIVHRGTAEDDQAIGTRFNDVFYSSLGADAYYGLGGNDTVSYIYSTGVYVDLGAGIGFGGYAEGDRFSGIENVIGSRSNDILLGSDGANTIDAGHGYDFIYATSGNDDIDGGSGFDTLSYVDATGGISVSIEHGEVDIDFGANTDSISNIEKIIGSDFTDIFRGDSGRNYFIGGEGSDLFHADAGRDYYSGGSGIDHLKIAGENIKVDLAVHRGYGGDAEGDRYYGIENVSISGGGLHVVGDGGDNQINLSINKLGVNMVDAGNGDDVVRLDSSLEFFANLSLAGTLIGGEGSDSLDMSLQTKGITLSRQDHIYHNNRIEMSDNGYLVTTGFENFIATSHDDYLVDQFASNNIYTGGSGSDIFEFVGSDSYKEFDVIKDYQAGIDSLYLVDHSGETISSLDQLDPSGSFRPANFEPINGIFENFLGTFINLGEHQILLAGVQISELSDFDFVG